MGDSIRVIVVVSEAYPELSQDLASIPPRLRAERIRALATMGLGVLWGGLRQRVTQEAEPSKDVSTGSTSSAQPAVRAAARKLGEMF